MDHNHILKKDNGNEPHIRCQKIALTKNGLIANETNL